MGTQECTAQAGTDVCSGQIERSAEHGEPDAISLRADRSAPRRARRFIRRVADHLPSELVERAELAVSELVSNAVIHGSRPGANLRLTVRADPERLRVEVADEGPGAQDVVSGDGGYGLEIVRRVSEAMAVYRGSRWRVVAEFCPRRD